jgi:LacI family transcriptional regulator
LSTMKDVAKMAQVSVSTVSHVLNGTRRVSEETRNTVLAIIAELGYQPNLLAKGLKTQRTFTVGLLISDIQNPFFTSVVRGIEDVALSRGYHLFLCNTDEDADREDEYLRELAKKQVDGLIVASAAPRQNHALRLKIQGIPFVFMDREVERVEADVVRVDNYLGMKLIADHLVGLGHRRIGMISGPLDKASGHERYCGLRTALASLGVDLEDSLVRFGDFKSSSGRVGARALLGIPSPPTALVTANNQMTLGALLEMQQMGFRVPEDISVVGFDDAEWAPLASPPLTALGQPTYEMGEKAMGLLLSRLEGGGEKEPERVLLEPWLTVRKSTSPLNAMAGAGKGVREI